MSKALVAYFRASKTTARVANELAQAAAGLERLRTDWNRPLRQMPRSLREKY